ncbi:MAG: RNA methyltransferase, partial [Desulfuromonadales bacterium]|nr:RNA methyltransferase [Desulfuromonadales bacterium]
MFSCVNRGGIDSLIRLTTVPILEQEADIDPASLRALEVWQARSGEVFTALAPDQTAFRIRMTLSADAQARCVPFERLRQSPESPLVIEIYQALPDKERFEMVLQKLTELGVSRIVPMQTDHSLTLAERDAQQKKSHRWPDVLLRAARQCRRAIVPELFDVVPFAAALEMASRAELSLMLYEGDSQFTIQEGIGSFQPQSVALMVGPEGGFSDAERDAAQNAGVLPVSLGPRILRTETAAIVGAAILQ